MRFAVALALCVPLAGCFSLTAPKTIPDWAMSPQAANPDEPQAKPRRVAVRRNVERVAVRPAERNLSGEPTNARSAGLSSERRGEAASATQGTGTKPYSAEWQAREDALDDKLRRRMNICNGC